MCVCVCVCVCVCPASPSVRNMCTCTSTLVDIIVFLLTNILSTVAIHVHVQCGQAGVIHTQCLLAPSEWVSECRLLYLDNV